MGRRGQSITLSISDRDKANLEALAEELGMMWGKRPNISKLLEAIAQGKLTLGVNHDWSKERIYALDSAYRALQAKGDFLAAASIAQLLQSRSELPLPVRVEVERFLSRPYPAWRRQIELFIQDRQPFRLIYQDAADRQCQYTILHARILTQDQQQYLVCRCLETEGNQELEPLRHNWTLRLDRINEAAVTSLPKPWSTGLDLMSAELHMRGPLAFTYDPKETDTSAEFLDVHPPVKRVVRQIFSSFWLFREILPYGKDCIIIQPESLRQRFRHEIQQLCHSYDIH